MFKVFKQKLLLMYIFEHNLVVSRKSFLAGCLIFYTEWCFILFCIYIVVWSNMWHLNKLIIILSYYLIHH